LGSQMYNNGTAPIVAYTDVQGGYIGRATSASTRSSSASRSRARRRLGHGRRPWGTCGSPQLAVHRCRTEFGPRRHTTDGRKPAFCGLPATADTASAPRRGGHGAYETAAAGAGPGRPAPTASFKASSIVLSGTGYSPTVQALTYAWTSTATASSMISSWHALFSAAGMQAADMTISLRLRDRGATATQSTVAPRAGAGVRDDSAAGLKQRDKLDQRLHEPSVGAGDAGPGEVIRVRSG